MRHLYIHVPFCQRRCSYCDFSIAVRKRIPAREYVEAVLGELAAVRAADPGRDPGDYDGESLETIYFGGGTPSLLPPEAISALLTSLRDAFHVTPSRDDVEVTLEANPEDVTLDHATAWRHAGINRVSL
ncbi:MAG TPA: radical SAM protein, partial [Gemmatimonadales bacterium]|nr:radical SAM protein [Gemmatimonadales bacterium]